MRYLRLPEIFPGAFTNMGVKGESRGEGSSTLILLHQSSHCGVELFVAFVRFHVFIVAHQIPANTFMADSTFDFMASLAAINIDEKNTGSLSLRPLI